MSILLPTKDDTQQPDAGDDASLGEQPAAAATSSNGGVLASVMERRSTKTAKAAVAAAAAAQAAKVQAAAASSSRSKGKNISTAPFVDPIANKIEWKQMTPAQQAFALTSKERIATVLGCWFEGDKYYPIFWGFTPPEVTAVAKRWKIKGKTIEALREGLFVQVEQWAIENPDLCTIDPPGLIRKRDGVSEKVAAARAAAESAAAAAAAIEEDDNIEIDELSGSGIDESEGSEYEDAAESRPTTPQRGSRKKMSISGSVGRVVQGLPRVGVSPGPPRARDAIPKSHRESEQFAAAASSSSSSHRTLKLGSDHRERSKFPRRSKHRHDHRHRSSNPSSNDDGFSDGDSDREFGSSGSNSKSRGLNINDPLAPNWIRNTLSGGATSVEARITSLAQSDNWGERSRHEAITLCRVIDAVRTNRLADAMEYAVRRVIGVGMAEKSKGDWGFCNMLGNYSEEQLFLDPQIYSKVQRMSSTQASYMNGLNNKKPANSYQQDNTKTPSNNQQKGKYNHGKDKPSNPENKPSQSGFPK